MSEKENSKPFLQVIVWELAAAYGLFRLIQSGSGQDPWTFRFVYNACFFLVAYPFLAFWRSGGVPGLLRFILFPIGVLLHLALMVSSYLWVMFVLWSFQRPDVLNLMANRPVVIGFLFFLLYWSFVGPVLGTTGNGMKISSLLRLTLFTVVTGLIGYLIGRGLGVTLTARQWPQERCLWILALSTLLFALVGSWVGKIKAGREN